ncbi:Carbamate kinase 1 [bioreactor metagenome]|uniref:Carbamate kinase 1 n=1 Tax=bioreactor metagenome TaxID=1076179 RepID=A0A645J9Q5_9ZZZZ
MIDKDLAAERLAEDMETDILLILTEVDKISLNFNKPNQRQLSSMTVAEAINDIEEGHFAPGSMLPKVMAAIKFARRFPGKKAIITSLYKAVEALDGKEGTVITMA